MSEGIALPRSVAPANSFRDLFFKDEVLDRLAARANVAQFVSFDADLRQRYCRIHGHSPNQRFDATLSAVGALLQASPEGLVNIRTYYPSDSKSQPFKQRLGSVEEVLALLRHFAGMGLYTIVNETIGEKDGGVSGVVLGDLVEFAPEATPRCVDQPDIAWLPRELALRLLEQVYSFRPVLDFPAQERVEFSLHPLRRGYRREHTIIWELKPDSPSQDKITIRWPNRFSRWIGDKAFGLLVANAIGLPVPRTNVISRHVAPFTFGIPTGTQEFWIRTCPVEQEGGKFTTQRGWIDPFQLLAREDPKGTALASILAQEGVNPAYSGAMIFGPDGKPSNQGVRGTGDAFMTAKVAPQALPERVSRAVDHLVEQAQAKLGPVRLEWVYDGDRAWVVQLHVGATTTQGRIIVPGPAKTYHRFGTNEGLEALRTRINELRGTGDGIILEGLIGVNSHMGDILRKAAIPSYLEPPAEEEEETASDPK